MLVEVLIVVAIMAMLSSGIAVAAYNYYTEAKLKTAQTSARSLRHTVQAWRLNNDSCPDIAELKKDNALDSDSKPTDPWNNPWELTCEAGDVQVLSLGPDGKRDTEDDIHAPKHWGKKDLQARSED